LEHTRDWRGGRVYYVDTRGRRRYLPAEWTNLSNEDPFVIISAGRSRLRIADLLELAKVVKPQKKKR
jgi:hypothetical protein